MFFSSPVVLSHDMSDSDLNQFFLTRVRHDWPELSEEESLLYIEILNARGIASIFTEFNAGDRLYGFNGGTVPYMMLFYKAKLFDPYALIIDPLYNTFLQEAHDVLGLPAFEESGFEESCVRYHAFYQADDKLRRLLEKDLTDRTHFADACIRMCKLGILETLQEGNKIHFVLDGLNIEDIVTKADKSGGQVPVGYYTNKEVRFCYRLSIVCPELAENIVFWQDNKQIPAPWLSNPEVWSQYQPKMLDINEKLESIGRGPG
ncbi:MAG: hypothetical protein K0U37_01310 [Gammaproteobacteria bacterium]|nr:hypothetical protein [Gammaproteobacteria bacterium]